MYLLDDILNYKSLSIIGNYKNVGKTTTLNYIISELLESNKVVGLTSIGVDGESVDAVTKTNKPKIYIKKDSLIATAKSCVLKSDITKEILINTSINTPLGNIVIFKSLSDGYVELAGPSTNSQIKYICDTFKKCGVDISIVDGAISRKTLGSPTITESTIFCSGAIINKNMKYALNQIEYEVEILNLDKIKDDKFFEIYKMIETQKICFVNKDYTYKKLYLSTTLNLNKDVYDMIDENTKYMVVNGIITDNFIDGLLKNGRKFLRDIILLVVDSTKIFSTSETYYKFLKLGGVIKTIRKINLIGISINPTSIEGYSFDEKEFLEKIRQKTSTKVFNVMKLKKNRVALTL